MQIFNPTRHFELCGRVERRNARLANKTEDANERKRLNNASQAAAKIGGFIKAGKLADAFRAIRASKPMQEQLVDTWEVLSNMVERNEIELASKPKATGGKKAKATAEVQEAA